MVHRVSHNGIRVRPIVATAVILKPSGMGAVLMQVLGRNAVVLASDHEDSVSGPQRGLELTNVRGDALAVEGEVSRRSRAVKRWPKYWISQRVYKAAFRR